MRAHATPQEDPKTGATRFFFLCPQHANERPAARAKTQRSRPPPAPTPSDILALERVVAALARGPQPVWDGATAVASCLGAEAKMFWAQGERLLPSELWSDDRVVREWVVATRQLPLNATSFLWSALEVYCVPLTTHAWARTEAALRRIADGTA